MIVKEVKQELKTAMRDLTNVTKRIAKIEKQILQEQDRLAKAKVADAAAKLKAKVSSKKRSLKAKKAAPAPVKKRQKAKAKPAFNPFE